MPRYRRAAIPTALISRMPSPIYRSLPVIDDMPAAISVARSQSSGSEGRSPKGSSALRHFGKGSPQGTVTRIAANARFQPCP
jgi:hypothetical protein